MMTRLTTAAALAVVAPTAPTVQLPNVEISEGDSGGAPLVVNVALDRPNPYEHPVSVAVHDYTTIAVRGSSPPRTYGTATPGQDYKALRSRSCPQRTSRLAPTEGVMWGSECSLEELVAYSSRLAVGSSVPGARPSHPFADRWRPRRVSAAGAEEARDEAAQPRRPPPFGGFGNDARVFKVSCYPMGLNLGGCR